VERLGSVGIFVADLDRAVEFYGTALGFRRSADFGTYALLDSGPGASLIVSSLPEGRAVEDVGASVLKIVIMADDAAATIEKIVAAGGSLVETARPRDGIPYTIGMASDPDGHLLEIIQQDTAAD
jgi:predicted enzyme related to lactoylglutathione lyase